MILPDEFSREQLTQAEPPINSWGYGTFAPYTIASAMCAVAGVVFLVSSREGSRRDVSVVVLCPGVELVWSDPFRVLSIAVPRLWRLGGSAIFLALALFFAARARRKVSRLV